MPRALLFLAFLTALFALVGFRSVSQEADLKWLHGQWSGTEIYEDEEDGIDKKLNLNLSASSELGRFEQIDFDFTGDDPEVADKFRLMIVWDKFESKYRVWYFESDPEEEEPIYETDNEFLAVSKDKFQWGDDQGRLTIAKGVSELVFTVEESNDEGKLETVSEIHLKPKAE